VLGEVVAAGKLLGALDALEGLLAGVRPEVPVELIGARESLAALGLAADEGLDARVPGEVGPQVGALAVALCTVVIRADELALGIGGERRGH